MKILVIEDELTQLYRYKQQLEINDGIEVITFPNVEDFLATKSNINDFDLIISDYNLGKNHIDGMNFFKQIEKDFKGKLILLTGEGNLQLKTKSFFSRKIHYLDKTIDVIDEIENHFL